VPWAELQARSRRSGSRGKLNPEEKAAAGKRDKVKSVGPPPYFSTTLPPSGGVGRPKPSITGPTKREVKVPTVQHGLSS
jgi:hypothetical protein